MAFNLKEAKKKSTVQPGEQQLQGDRERFDLAPADATTTESLLDEERRGYQKATTEGQFDKRKDGEAAITEKQMDRPTEASLFVPAISAVVTDIVNKRRSEFTSLQEKDKDHWTMAKTTQNADLPKWPGTASQPDDIQLANDPRRKPDEMIGKAASVGGMIRVASAVRKGETADYDQQILAVLKPAIDAGRELTTAEQNKIASLKQARTTSILGG